MQAQRHVYRQGNRFNYQAHGDYIGYFVRTYWDGLTSWSWTWAQWAKQDQRANDWICGELGYLNERES